MGTAILVTSGKGGTGKTSVTAGVSSCLAALGQKVLCVDLDVGLRGLDLVLGMTDRAVMDFSDVMAGRSSLAEAAARQPNIPGLFLLTAPIRLEDGELDRFRAVMEEAKEQFDYIFLDSPAGLGEGFQLGRAGADQTVVVATADPAALRDAQRTVSELGGADAMIHLVMNRVDPGLIRRQHTTIDAAMDTVGLPLLGVVPEDEKVAVCAGLGRPLVLWSHKGAAQACLNIARRLLGRRAPLGSR